MHERQGRGIMCVREGRRSPKKEKEGGFGGGGSHKFSPALSRLPERSPSCSGRRRRRRGGKRKGIVTVSSGLKRKKVTERWHSSSSPPAFLRCTSNSMLPIQAEDSPTKEEVLCFSSRPTNVNASPVWESKIFSLWWCKSSYLDIERDPFRLWSNHFSCGQWEKWNCAWKENTTPTHQERNKKRFDGGSNSSEYMHALSFPFVVTEFLEISWRNCIPLTPFEVGIPEHNPHHWDTLGTYPSSLAL